ncbi:sugar-binding transcriptional regulator [Paracoccus saliphilus]|uniref:Transcriptional regulator n=1 Tax=Paracoccus saliphilus TaxID=405559 RepID=A0AA45W5J2_9RHOB|nr:sugar-binding domain-containing protein [Paracoccus saliphilus]WCR02355.1 transcriptional regulator [Paracoccus saliphilus]SIS94051.1 DNA-binding transcriptional regulator LsrR, DeoR family [Paracoccus saliphilus]
MDNIDISEEDAFLAQVCWQYYVNELTQAEIAKYLGVTRLRVNQAIQKAKSTGAVRVQIESPYLPRIELQERLQERFGLRRVQVAPTHPQIYDFHRPAGAALASYMLDRVKSGEWRRIGVSWGMTLQATIDRLPKLSMPDVEIISMIGGTSRGEMFNSFGIASGFAERFGARYSLLAAPIFLGEEVERRAFLAQENFEKHFKKLETLDAAILTASNISAKSYLISSGLPEGVTSEGLIASGAIGDVVCRFLDIDGKLVSDKLDRQTIGIELEILKSVPDRILAAAGPHKVDIIRVIASQGIATTLITDDVTAKLLLDE